MGTGVGVSTGPLAGPRPSSPEPVQDAASAVTAKADINFLLFVNLAPSQLANTTSILYIRKSGRGKAEV